MLKKLILKNWKSHLNTEIEFDSGYNVIVGNIGSGKSSIIEAIVFALFGTTQSVVSRKVQVKDLIMAKPLEMDTARIELTFESEGKEYKVERLLYKTKSSQAKIYEDDVLLRGPKPSDVNDEIEKILGIDIDVFMRANFSEQNQVDFFLKMPPQQRKQLFDNMFGIDLFDTLSVNSRKIATNLSNKIMEKQERNIELNSMIKSYNIEELKKNEEEFTQKIEKEEKELEEINKDIQELGKQTKELEIKQTIFEETETKTKRLNGQIDYIRHESDIKNSDKDKLNEKGKIDEKVLELKQREIDLKGKEKEIQNLKIEFSKKKERIENFNLTLEKNKKYLEENNIDVKVERNIEYLKAKLKDFDEKISKEKESTYKNKSKIESIEREIKEIDLSIEKINKLGGKCPTCEQDLNEEHKVKINREKGTKKYDLLKEIEEIKKILETQENTVKELINNKNETDKELNKNKEILTRKEYISRIEKDNKELLEQAVKLEVEIKELDINIKNFKNIEAEIEINNKALEKIKDELKRLMKIDKYFKLLSEKEILDNKIKTLDYNKEKHNELKTKIATINESINYKKTIINQDKKILKDNEFKIGQYKELNKKIRELQKETKRINDLIDDLKIYSNVAKKTQEDVRNMMVEKINIIFMDLWPKVYPYADFEQIRLGIVDGDYRLLLHFDKGYVRELDDFVSGGEKSSIALTLRLAMSLVMKNKLNLLVLDEPTHNLDENSVLALSNLLNEHLPKFINQTFVITHDKTLENYAKSIYRISRDKLEDSPSIVEKKE